MASRESIAAGARTAIEAFGDVSILINNAGVVSGVNIMELTD